MSPRLIFIYGFALFAMFFGSGNLVFPIQIGKVTTQHWAMGFLGLLATGIVLPFLGLMVVKRYGGSYTRFFAEGGRVATHVLPFFTLSLLGSFGVVPRCITVAHAGVSSLFPQLSLSVFSAAFCLLTFFFCRTSQRILSALGQWMSPLLLGGLSVLIIYGLLASTATLPTPAMTSTSALSHGFMTGYQTMDLFASFFFSAFIFNNIRSALPSGTSDPDIVRFAIKASLIGMVLLSLTYLGLVLLGAHFQQLLTGVPPEHMLAMIAHHAMGPSATIVLAVVMLLSCLTTAVALNNIYAQYLTDRLNGSEKTFGWLLGATTGLAFVVSLFDFKGIAQFLAPVLEVSYPSLIMLTLLCLGTKRWPRLKIFSFYCLLAVMLVKYVGEVLAARIV